MKMRWKEYVNKFFAGVVYPFQSISGTLGIITITTLIYAVTVLSIYPGYSLQLIGAGWWYMDDALLSLTRYSLTTSGITGVILTVLNALFGSIALVNIGSQLAVTGKDTIKGVSSLTPGLLASGCASCGVGLISLAGVSGFLATLPFNGNLLRLGGVILIIGVIASIGNPRSCDLPNADDIST